MRAPWRVTGSWTSQWLLQNITFFEAQGGFEQLLQRLHNPSTPPPVLPPASGSSASPSGSRAEQGIAVGSGGEGKAAANQDRSIKRPPLAVIRALVEVAGQATPLLSREFVQRFAPRLAERLIPLLLDMPDTELRGMCRGDA